MSETIVIAGAGHAAGQAAVSLRQGGFSGRVVMIGDEPYLPYQRPPLSKKFLAGKVEIGRLVIRQEKFYADHNIELRLSMKVVEIDCAKQSVRLSNDEKLDYDRLILATGSRVRTIDMPGVDLNGVHYLRTIDDVLRMQGDFKTGNNLIVIGAGYIGLEVAAVAITSGLHVTVLETADRVMNRVVAPEVSAFFEAVHREAGVDIPLNLSRDGEIIALQVKSVNRADLLKSPQLH